MGLGKDMPDTVTKFDLIKIIHLLSKKLDWIDEDEEPIDQGSGHQDGLEAQTNEECVADNDIIINDRNKSDGCNENNSIKIEENETHSATSDVLPKVDTSIHEDKINEDSVDMLGNTEKNIGADTAKIAVTSFEDSSKLAFGCSVCDQKFSKESYVAAHM